MTALASPPTRDALIAQARQRRRFRCLIIGAGINGLGVFRDLSLQGVDCLIVDQGDFCAGTSAAPSRMIHGGLKYLETGEFRLVREATLERNRLLRNAAHLVRPLETVVPLPSWLGGAAAALGRLVGLATKPHERGLMIIAAGLSLYDFLGRHERTLPRHRLMGRRGLEDLVAGIDRRFVAGAVYSDAAITQPERLGLELAQDGMAANPACSALNHVALDGAQDGRITLQDRIGGDRFEVEPEIIVNAAGPWIDRVNGLLGVPTRHIGGTKGSHLILDHPDLLTRLDGRMVYFESADGRICLVYPYQGRILLGSTDIPVDDPDQARCEADEVAYMLRALAGVFPDIAVRPQDILFTYCGVRPLPRTDAADPGQISRDHSVPISEAAGERPAILSLVGGKWTTFRAFAEEVSDALLARLEVARSCSTRDLAIGGGRDFPADPSGFAHDLAPRHGISVARAGCLLERYGTAAHDIARFCAADDDAPLAALPDTSRREIRWLAEHELVGRLADVVLRRTTLAITGRLSPAAAEEILAIVAAAQGWDEPRRRLEWRLLASELAERHGVILAAAAVEEVPG